MNDKLHNKTVYVGRSDSGSKLIIAVTVGNAIKIASMGAVGSVPGSVSRWKPNEKKAHCKISIDAKGAMVVTNMVDANITKVNGVSIVEKAIKSDDSIMLGRDDFALNISKTLEVAEKLIGASSPGPDPGKEYDTTPMAAIWDEYHSKTLMMRIRQRKINNIRLLGIAFGMLGTILAFILPFPYVREICGVIGAIVFIVCLYMSFRDKTIEEQETLNKWMEKNYLYPCCPHFAGMVPYASIKQREKCPFCGAKLKHKED